MHINLIDIHIHILPGVDDGARNSEETKAMLKLEYERGVRRIVATPHCFIDENAAVRADRIKHAFEKTCLICSELAEETGEEEIELLLGSEIYCSAVSVGRIPEMIRRGDVFSINNGRYVLIEMNYSISFDEMFRIIKPLSDEGYIPVLAHVERYENLYRKLEYIEKLIDSGVIIQMNAKSLVAPRSLKEKFSRNRKWCWQLMESGCVHIIGSDAHRNKNDNNIAEAIDNIRNKIGEKKILQLINNAEKIILDENI